MSPQENNSGRLPEELSDLFWDHDFEAINWDEHRDFVIRRVLAEGTWEQICWLRDIAGDDEIRRVIVQRRGRELTPRQLRFWQLIVDLPKRRVDEWLTDPERQVWDRRTR